MSEEKACPRCQRANDDANAQHDAANEDGQDIVEELASVRRQLTEATDLLGSLHNRVIRLEARITRDAEVRRPERGDDGAIVEQPTAAVTGSASVPVTSEAAAVPQETPDTLEPLRYRAPEAPEIAFRIDWEQVLGRNWFAIIGGIAVVLGLGFFLKLAFDNNWINDIGRIALGVVVGIGFLGVGEYAQRRVPRWAQAVTASGTAILYLTIYAAFGLYQMISPTAAFLLLAVVVTVAVLLALRYESLVIALLGLVGAFISPVLLGPDLPDERLALVYILIVDVGILAISTFRNWRWLTLVGLVGSYGIFAYWMLEVTGFNPVFAQIALTGIFLTFAAATPLFHILWRRMPGATDLSLMSLNAVVYFALTTAILWDDYEGWFGLIAFGLTALYGLIALAALKRSGVPARTAVFALGIAAVFLTMAFPLQFSGYSVAIAWAAQGAVMVWMSFYLGTLADKGLRHRCPCPCRLPLGSVRPLGGCGRIYFHSQRTIPYDDCRHRRILRRGANLPAQPGSRRAIQGRAMGDADDVGDSQSAHTGAAQFGGRQLPRERQTILVSGLRPGEQTGN